MAFVDLKKAIELLKSHQVVGVPTETVYGLAGRIDSETALKKIFETKKRPFFDPLIVHLSADMTPQDYVQTWPSIYDLLAKKFWPGPLTLIAPKKKNISDLITSGLPEVGLRCPAHPLIQEVIQTLQIPLAAPSANLFGKTSPTTAQHVEDEFAGLVAVLDGGPCAVGVESTVVRWNDEKNLLEVLRPGLVTEAELSEIAEPLGIGVVRAVSSVAPGHLKQHYQPKAPLILKYGEKQNLKSLSPLKQKISLPSFELVEIPLNDAPEQVARRLYADLRRLSERPKVILVAQVEESKRSDPHWAMVLDRLEKASSLIISC